MHILSATYRVATDMFLSRDGVDAELRSSSVRGALRFWYRAMMWPELQDWRKVKEHEERLFGSSDQQVGQSRVLISVTAEHQLEINSKGAKGSSSIAYLGYGVMAFRRPGGGGPSFETTRAAIAAGNEFSVRLLFRPAHGRDGERIDKDVEQVSAVLQALGLFGGLGSRARNGLGSVNLQRLIYKDASGRQRSLWEPVSDINDLVQRQRSWVDKHLGELPGGEPVYTAFSKASRIITHYSTRNGMGALAYVGDKLGRYRRYRKSKNGTVQANFPDDHDAMYSFAKKETRQPPAPRRSVFGLPHNYFLSGIGHVVNVTARTAKGKPVDRRGGPLFIHVHEFGDGDKGAAVTFTFLPAQFLPDGAKLSFTATRGHGRSKQWVNSGASNPTSDWTPILEFIDNEEFWPRREVVLP